LPKKKTRIENKVLELCGYQRCRGTVLINLKADLQKIAPRYPKQRGLCKALIDLCAYNKIVLPTLSTVSMIVSDVWQTEQTRLIVAYKRYSNKVQRQQLLAVLDKGERFDLITMLRQEMKGYYNTIEIERSLEQHTLLLSAFTTAKEVLPN
jgi:hypothetical protein